MTDVSFAYKNNNFTLVVSKVTPNVLNHQFLSDLQFIKDENNNNYYKDISKISQTNLQEIIGKSLQFFKLPLWNQCFLNLIFLTQNYYNITSKEIQDMKDIDLPEFQLPLLKHQQDDVKFFLTCKKCILGSEMGTGKTASVIATLTHLKTKKNLIICPKTLRINWKREFNKFVPGFNDKIIIIESTAKCESMLLKKIKDFDNDTYFIIISYSLLNNVMDIFRKLNLLKWDMIIADESHFLKHMKSKRSKAFKLISKNSNRVIQLTATPAHKTCDLWNLLRVCNENIFKEFATPFTPKTMNVSKPTPKHFYYAERYTNTIIIRGNGGRLLYDYKTPKRLEELNVLTKPFILRRLLDDVVDLPPLIKEVICIGELSKKMNIHFQESFNKMKLIKNEKSKHEADVILMQLVRTTSQLKQSLVLEYLLEFIQSYHEKILVFFHFKQFGDFLEDGLNKAKIPNIKVHSDIKSDQRQDLFDLFTNPNSNIQIGLISLGTGSTGLNFICCRLCIYADLSFDMIAETQSEGRCRRIGQTNKVILRFLQLDHSTDEMLIKTMISQQKTSFSILDST